MLPISLRSEHLSCPFFLSLDLKSGSSAACQTALPSQECFNMPQVHSFKFLPTLIPHPFYTLSLSCIFTSFIWGCTICKQIRRTVFCLRKFSANW